MSTTAQAYLGHYPESELVLGVVCPLGTNYRPVLDTLANLLRQFGYETNQIQLSEQFDDMLAQLAIEVQVQGKDRLAEMQRKIRAGNAIREATQDDVLALIAASQIASMREEEPEQSAPKPLPLHAHVIVSLKHPKEVETLRRVYGSGFFLLAIGSSNEDRIGYFSERGIRQEAAKELIETDAKEESVHGQHTRDTFHLADVFISLNDYRPQLERLLDLVFGCPYVTPRSEEHAMFQAYSASLRSGDLSRQVGASLVSPEGDLLAVGCNEVPRFGGGQYGPEEGNQRDMVLGYDSNEIEKFEIAEKIIAALAPAVPEAERRAKARDSLRSTGFFDLTEFGRPMHAEMEAILACGRTGRSTLGATLYTTTFPCHNCTRYAIGAGITKVVYIEPYAKSKAFALHGDAISPDEQSPNRVPFIPFIGIGPRRYFDLFSMSLGTGYPIERKREGRRIEWKRGEATVRLQMPPTSYLNREVYAFAALQELLSKKGV